MECVFNLRTSLFLTLKISRQLAKYIQRYSFILSFSRNLGSFQSVFLPCGRIKPTPNTRRLSLAVHSTPQEQRDSPWHHTHRTTMTRSYFAFFRKMIASELSPALAQSLESHLSFHSPVVSVPPWTQWELLAPRSCSVGSGFVLHSSSYLLPT